MKNLFAKPLIAFLFLFISIIAYSQCEDFVVDTTLVKQTYIGGCDGQITLLPSGGTPPYTYSIYKSDTTQLISNSQITSNLCEDVYICNASDVLGCEYTHWIYLSYCNGFDYHSNYNNAYNNMCNGNLSVTLEGGTLPYEYLWYIQGGDTIAYVDTAFTNLCPNTYVLKAHDANNCKVNVGFGIGNATVDTCNNFDFSFTINDVFTSDTSCDGWVNLDVTGGTMPYTFEWEDEFGDLQLLDTSNLQNLCVGSYYLTITDSLGCTMESVFSQYVEDPCEALSLLAIPQHPSSELSCDGHLAVYTWYNWNYHSTVPELIETLDYTNLCAGIYNISYTDTLDCTKQKTVQLGPDPFENIHAYVTTNFDNYTNTCNGNAKVFVGGGIPPYSFSHSSGKTEQYINGLCAGLYAVTVTDANLETFVAEYVIADLNSTYYNQTYQDSIITGEISSAPIEQNYATYYHLFSDFHISSYEYVNNHLTVNWLYYYSLNEIERTQTWDISLESGVYTIEFGLYALSKSEPRYLTAKDNIYINTNSQCIETNKPNFNISAYPNPFNDFFTISTGKTSDYSVKVADINGKIILENIFNNTDIIDIETSDLESGFYIISVSNNTNTVNLKMVKK